MKTALYILSALALTSCGHTIDIEVVNELDSPRFNEIASVEVGRLKSLVSENFVIVDRNGRSVPYQITHDGYAIFPVNIPPKTTITYRVKRGKPQTDGMKLSSQYLSLFADTTKSDLAGASALIDASGQIKLPRRHDSYKVVDDGPLRFSVMLTYAPMTVDGDTSVVEERLVTIDKGSFISHNQVRYNHLRHDVKVAPSLPVNVDSTTIVKQGIDYIAVVDSASEGAAAPDSITFAALLTNGAKSDPIGYHMLPVATPNEGGILLAVDNYSRFYDYSYYSDIGNPADSIISPNQWMGYVENYSERLNSPLKITLR